jgi:endogenous inhibitor of DNA gyrase (YacG/DUF329 family)
MDESWEQMKAERRALWQRARRDRYKIKRGRDHAQAATWDDKRGGTATRSMSDEMLLVLIMAPSFRECDCGALFIAHHTARYCSAECQTNVRRPKRLQIKCANCNGPITPHATSRKTRRFCTVACKQRDYRKRQKGKIVTLTA